MGDIENANEIIDDLKDEIHDLTQDLKAANKETDRLETELQGMIEDEELREADHKRQLKVLEVSEDQKQEKVKMLTHEVSRLDHLYDELYHNYIKALSIAETVRVNGTTEYFRTEAGKNLLTWAVDELKREFHKIAKE